MMTPSSLREPAAPAASAVVVTSAVTSAKPSPIMRVRTHPPFVG
jgi:hypothetical protein